MIHRFVSRLFLAPALLLAATAAPALAQGRGIPRPAGQQVNIPYIMRDNFNVQWDVQMDGSIGDGGNDLYDGGGRLMIGGQQYNSPGQQVIFDAKANEVTLGDAQMQGLTVHRRIAVNAAQGWCRWAEVLENNSGAVIRAAVSINFDMGGGVQQQQQVVAPKKNTPLGGAIFDGQRGIACLGGGVGGKVACRYTPQLNSDQVNLAFDVEVPARGAAVVVHFQAMRPNMNDATTWVSSAKEKDLLGDMPKEIRRSIVNFRRAGESAVADIELPRTPLLDVVELTTGDQLRGTLKDAAYKVRTFHGVVELPADQVIGMITVGAHRPTQLFVTVEGEVVGGTLVGDGLGIQLSSGQSLVVPLDSIAKVGCRKRPTEQEDLKIDKPMAYLRDGQRIAVDLPDGTDIAASTLYGQVQLKPDWVQSIGFVGDDQPSHVVRLKDGSKFSALVGGPAIELKLRGAGTGGAPTTQNSSASSEGSTAAVKFPLAMLTRLQFSPADAEPDDADPPTLALSNGDSLVGTLDGALEVETAFDTIKLNGSEVRGLKHAEARETKSGPSSFTSPVEVTVTMWDGATVSGRLKGDAVKFALRSGGPVTIPVALVDRYAQPHPAPSGVMVDQIKLVVKDLSDADWKKRDRAAGQLKSIGPTAIGVLKQVRGDQPPASQKLIDGIIKELEKQAAPPPAAAQPANDVNIRRLR